MATKCNKCNTIVSHVPIQKDVFHTCRVCRVQEYDIRMSVVFSRYLRFLQIPNTTSSLLRAYENFEQKYRARHIYL
jgi:hypothetical protein